MRLAFFLLIVVLALSCLWHAARTKSPLARRVWLGYHLDFVGAAIFFTTFLFPRLDDVGFYTLLVAGATISTVGTALVWWQRRRRLT